MIMERVVGESNGPSRGSNELPGGRPRQPHWNRAQWVGAKRPCGRRGRRGPSGSNGEARARWNARKLRRDSWGVRFRRGSTLVFGGLRPVALGMSFRPGHPGGSRDDSEGVRFESADREAAGVRGDAVVGALVPRRSSRVGALCGAQGTRDQRLLFRGMSAWSGSGGRGQPAGSEGLGTSCGCLVGLRFQSRIEVLRGSNAKHGGRAAEHGSKRLPERDGFRVHCPQYGTSQPGDWIRALDRQFFRSDECRGRGVVWHTFAGRRWIPRGLRLTARAPKNSTNAVWHVDYEYSEDFLAGRLPATSRLSWESAPGKRQLTDLFRLRYLEEAERPLEPALFHYAQIHRAVPTLYVYTNNALYISLLGDFASLVPVRYVAPESGDRRRPAVRYAVPAAMAAGTVVLWLLLRRERSRALGK